jgi:hypothetical protein
VPRISAESSRFSAWFKTLGFWVTVRTVSVP